MTRQKETQPITRVLRQGGRQPGFLNLERALNSFGHRSVQRTPSQKDFLWSKHWTLCVMPSDTLTRTDK